MIIRQQAFSEECNVTMYKGGLHCHTTRSDGHGTPKEVIRLYKKNGYDFLALTDHCNYNFENYAPDCDITIIPGMEYNNRGNMITITDRDDTLTSEYDSVGFRCFHTVCLGRTKADGNPYEQDEKFPAPIVDCQETYQPYLDKLHQNGQLTIHCHPQWSSTPARYFAKLRGNIAMEIWNSICAIESDMDRDAVYWDELLGQGIRIWGVAADDGHAMHHHCVGWVQVRAADRSVNAILDAICEGRFYSSCGPEIYDFYVEDDRAVVICSNAAKIRLHADKHPTRIVRSSDCKLTRAEFDLNGNYSYVRAVVIDGEGKYAWTNPVFHY